LDNRIFYYEGSGGGSERCLEVNDDGSLLYWDSPNYYAHMGGAKFKSETLSAAEAKKRWPEHAAEIDRRVRRRSN
jgi:hypothetical protein